MTIYCLSIRYITTDPLFSDRMQNMEATCQMFKKYEQTGVKPHLSKCLNDKEPYTEPWCLSKGVADAYFFMNCSMFTLISVHLQTLAWHTRTPYKKTVWNGTFDLVTWCNMTKKMSPLWNSFKELIASCTGFCACLYLGLKVTDWQNAALPQN